MYLCILNTLYDILKAMSFSKCYLMDMNLINAHELNALFLCDQYLTFCSANIGYKVYIFIIIITI